MRIVLGSILIMIAFAFLVLFSAWLYTTSQRLDLRYSTLEIRRSWRIFRGHRWTALELCICGKETSGCSRHYLRRSDRTIFS